MYILVFLFQLIDIATNLTLIRKIILYTTQYVWRHIYKRYFPIWKMSLMICNQLSVGNFNRLSLWCASISLLLPLPLISSSNASVATVFSSDFLRSYCTVNMKIVSKSRSPYTTMDYGSIHLMADNCCWRNTTQCLLIFTLFLKV